MKERSNQTLGRMKKSTIGIDGEPLPILDTEIPKGMHH